MEATRSEIPGYILGDMYSLPHSLTHFPSPLTFWLTEVVSTVFGAPLYHLTYVATSRYTTLET